MTGPKCVCSYDWSKQSILISSNITIEAQCPLIFKCHVYLTRELLKYQRLMGRGPTSNLSVSTVRQHSLITVSRVLSQLAQSYHIQHSLIKMGVKWGCDKLVVQCDALLWESSVEYKRLVSVIYLTPSINK